MTRPDQTLRHDPSFVILASRRPECVARKSHAPSAGRAAVAWPIACTTVDERNLHRPPTRKAGPAIVRLLLLLTGPDHPPRLANGHCQLPKCCSTDMECIASPPARLPVQDVVSHAERQSEQRHRAVDRPAPFSFTTSRDGPAFRALAADRRSSSCRSSARRRCRTRRGYRSRTGRRSSRSTRYRSSVPPRCRIRQTFP
jgi:hypothetical protein